MNYKIEIIRSKRRTAAVEISKDLKVLIRVPLRTTQNEIETILKRSSGWIDKHLELQSEKNKRQTFTLSDEQAALLKRKASEIIPSKVLYYSRIMGVFPTGIKITSAKTRWGSCSAKNSLCFSSRLMLLPDVAVDYVVVHELAHIRVRNHSKAFYREIEKYLPDYRERVKLIKEFCEITQQ